MGTVRELLDATGAVVSRFAYDPWGRRTQVSGTVDSSVGYAGYFRHAASGLDLTLFRAYDPEQGRWLSRDPIFEAGGMNLYGYVGNSPLNGVDVWGLDPGKWLNSPDEAALDWVDYMRRNPEQYNMEGREWQTDIYRTFFGYYSYTRPVPCYGTKCRRPPFGKAWPAKKTNECHSHPSDEQAHAHEMDGDKRTTREHSIPFDRYVLTADGRLFKILGHSGNSLPVE